MARSRLAPETAAGLNRLLDMFSGLRAAASLSEDFRITATGNPVVRRNVLSVPTKGLPQSSPPKPSFV